MGAKKGAPRALQIAMPDPPTIQRYNTDDKWLAIADIRYVEASVCNVCSTGLHRAFYAWALMEDSGEDCAYPVHTKCLAGLVVLPEPDEQMRQRMADRRAVAGKLVRQLIEG